MFGAEKTTATAMAAAVSGGDPIGVPTPLRSWKPREECQTF